MLSISEAKQIFKCCLITMSLSDRRKFVWVVPLSFPRSIKLASLFCNLYIVRFGTFACYVVTEHKLPHFYNYRLCTSRIGLLQQLVT